MEEATQQTMTYEQLVYLFKETRDFLNASAIDFEETKRLLRESHLETELQFKETSEQFKEIAIQSKITDQKFKETDERFKETAERFKETDEQFKKTDLKIKELSEQIGGLHGKYGSFNEALFMPSLTNILQEKFKCKTVAPRFRFRNNGSSFEADLVGLNQDFCYIIEIKSKLQHKSIDQLKKIISQYKNFAELYNNQKAIGIICATDYNEDTVKAVHKAGFLFISVADNIAQLYTPQEFKPKAW